MTCFRRHYNYLFPISNVGDDTPSLVSAEGEFYKENIMAFGNFTIKTAK
jgi:hypothetical protein